MVINKLILYQATYMTAQQTMTPHVSYDFIYKVHIIARRCFGAGDVFDFFFIKVKDVEVLQGQARLHIHIVSPTQKSRYFINITSHTG